VAKHIARVERQFSRLLQWNEESRVKKWDFPLRPAVGLSSKWHQTSKIQRLNTEKKGGWSGSDRWAQSLRGWEKSEWQPQALGVFEPHVKIEKEKKGASLEGRVTEIEGNEHREESPGSTTNTMGDGHYVEKYPQFIDDISGVRQQEASVGGTEGTKEILECFAAAGEERDSVKKRTCG